MKARLNRWVLSLCLKIPKFSAPIRSSGRLLHVDGYPTKANLTKRIYLTDRLLYIFSVLQEVEVLRKQVVHLSEENGKLVGHKNHKQRIEYLVKLKKDNTRLQEEIETLRSEMSLMRDAAGYPPPEMM
ncbi:hypothetical protein LDENG_00231010 [Lucifuga dentata]|nr:hypothetical protein LDENG_00231010 [Lucifuga dentata]